MTPWMRAGVVAAAFSGAPSTLVAIMRGHDVLASTEAIGAVVLRDRSGRAARLVAGVVAHVLISLAWARVLERALRDNDSAAGSVAAGAVCGAGIAALDLGLIGRRLPAIRSLDIGPQIADHVAFGALVGWVLRPKS